MLTEPKAEPLNEEEMTKTYDLDGELMIPKNENTKTLYKSLFAFKATIDRLRQENAGMASAILILQSEKEALRQRVESGCPKDKKFDCVNEYLMQLG